MLAIIGGSGLSQLAGLEVTRREGVRTPYGEPSGPLAFGRIGGRDEGLRLAAQGIGRILTHRGQSTKFAASHQRGSGHRSNPARVKWRSKEKARLMR